MTSASRSRPRPAGAPAPVVPQIVAGIHQAFSLGVASTFSSVSEPRSWQRLPRRRCRSSSCASRRPPRQPQRLPAMAAVRHCPPPTDQPSSSPQRPRSDPEPGPLSFSGYDGPDESTNGAFPHGLAAAGTVGAPYIRVLDAAELPAGAMRRVTHGDLDILLANTPDGIVAVDDRCPHMSAPLSLGSLEGCVVACPLHEGLFDLSAATWSGCRQLAGSTPTAVPPHLVAGGPRAEGRSARAEGRGAPAHPRPSPPLLPGSDRRRSDRGRGPELGRSRGGAGTAPARSRDSAAGPPHLAKCSLSDR